MLSNAQSELSALERGMHALQATEKGKHGRSVAAYAVMVGREATAVWREVYAAEVSHEIMPYGKISATILDAYPRHLAEIHAAPREAWPALVGSE